MWMKAMRVFAQLYTVGAEEGRLEPLRMRRSSFTGSPALFEVALVVSDGRVG